MAYWLFKSEPGTWSWDDQVKCGAKGTEWDGVRNYMANNFMKEMKIGDKGFFYHSVNEKQVVGIVEVIGEHVMDPTDAKGKFGMVQLKAVEPVPNFVTLADIKGDPALEDMVLVKNSRLSVQPVTPAEWKKVCAMGGLKKAPK
ncbi:EVE domain-containing protein [Pyruvatibacter sp.]|uniref:EVE domain-containing protein n=1 Tax=unclassified Pyruvatibacter TaxID=2618840 RepID=UPI0029682090|nr:EVE domain-containing protein [Alphaproteobacteria bacterium]